MKKFWKALGITALAAAVPLRFKKDDITGKKTYQSLLISVDVCPSQNNTDMDIGINLGEGLLTNAISGLISAITAKKETIHFADDEPEAAVVEPIEPVKAETVETAVEEATVETVDEPVATEADFDPEL